MQASAISIRPTDQPKLTGDDDVVVTGRDSQPFNKQPVIVSGIN